MLMVNISEKEKAQILSEIEACDIGFDEGTVRIDQDVNVSTKMDADDTVVIVQEVKAADKKKGLTEYKLNESGSSQSYVMFNFECGYCKNYFSSHHKFDKHMTEVHQCNYCDTYFSDLREHIKEKHLQQRC